MNTLLDGVEEILIFHLMCWMQGIDAEFTDKIALKVNFGIAEFRNSGRSECRDFGIAALGRSECRHSVVRNAGPPIRNAGPAVEFPIPNPLKLPFGMAGCRNGDRDPSEPTQCQANTAQFVHLLKTKPRPRIIKRNHHCDISLNQSPDSLKCADRKIQANIQ